MDMKNILITLVVVIVGVIAASLVAKKFNIGQSSWEESYDEE